jgi:hypothetical protein
MHPAGTQVKLISWSLLFRIYKMKKLTYKLVSASEDSEDDKNIKG